MVKRPHMAVGGIRIRIRIILIYLFRDILFWLNLFVQCKGEYGSIAARPPLCIPSMAYSVDVSQYLYPAVNRHRLQVAVSFWVCKKN